MSEVNGLIDSVFDEKKIQEQVKNIEKVVSDWLTTTQKQIKEFGNKSIELHLQVKSDTNLKDLIATMREFSKVSQQMETATQKVSKVQTEMAAIQRTAATATKEIIFVQDKQKKSAEEMTTALDEAADAYRFYATPLETLTKDLADNSAMLAKAKAQVKEYTKAFESMKSKQDWTPISPEAIKEVEANLGKASAEVIKYTAAVKANKDELKLAKAAEENVITSYDARSAMMRSLQKISREMGNETEEQTFHQKELAKAADTFNEWLKESDEAMGNHQRKVGQYENATKGLRGIITDMTNEMAELSLAGLENSERYQELQAKTNEYSKALLNVQKTTRALRSNTADADALRQSLQALNVAFVSLRQIGGFAEEGTKLDSVMKNLQKTIGLVSAATEIYNLVGKNSLLIAKLSAIQANLVAKSKVAEATATGKATIAQKAFNLVAKANPYVLLAAGIGAIIGALSIFSSRTTSLEKAQKDLNKAQAESIKSAGEQAAKIDLLSKTVEKGNLSLAQQEAVVIQLNEVLKDSGKQVKTYAEAEQFLTNNSKAYIESLVEKAKQQAILNEYQKAYGELLAAQQERELKVQQMVEETGMSLEELSGKLGGTGQAFIDKLNKPIEQVQEKLEFLRSEMSGNMDFLGIEKGYNELMKSIDEANRTDQQKQDEYRTVSKTKINAHYDAIVQKHQDTKKLIDKIPLFQYIFGAGMGTPEDLDEVNKQRASDLEKLNKSIAAKSKVNDKTASDEKMNILYKQQELEIRIMQESFAKTEKELNLQRTKELEEAQKTFKDKEALKKAETNINIHYDNEVAKAREENDKKALEVQKTNIENRLSYVEKGGQEELDLRLQLLQMQEDEELAAVIKTGADSQEIIKKFDKEKQDLILQNTIDTATKEVEERLRIMLEAQVAEEQALLEKYKKGEISEEEYNKNLKGIRDKYAAEALKVEIANLDELLKKEGLSAEQRAALIKQLTDKKIELSDQETEAEVANLDKVKEKRKKNAELAKQYAQEAFAMTMDFLTQTSEARQAELEAELERLEEKKEADLAELENSVMSEETRAAEEKRINDEYEAQKAVLEAKKREEEVKQFRYNQLQSIAQAGMNIAEGITKVIGQTGIASAVWIPIISALGAAQIAMILAQKPPKYAKGTDDHIGGWAFMGDGGKKEYAVTPTGNVIESLNIPALYDLPKHTQVFPDYASYSKAINPIPQYEKNVDYSADLHAIKDDIVNAINRKTHTQSVNVSIDSRGINYIATNGVRTQRFTGGMMNRKV